MTHPLTDEICADISPKRPFGRVLGEVRYCNDMRAGADWQLEQVIRYLENDLEFVLWSDSFMDKFKKAMRPQQKEVC